METHSQNLNCRNVEFEALSEMVLFDMACQSKIDSTNSTVATEVIVIIS
jgi:hypothetical protein